MVTAGRFLAGQGIGYRGVFFLIRVARDFAYL